MIHHKETVPGRSQIKRSKYIIGCRRYGVSYRKRFLTPSLFIKKYDLIRSFLAGYVGLSLAEREACLRLLRIWSYYGVAYPKESQITQDPGCSKATFWRMIRALENKKLIEVINRYIIRPKAQISNQYQLNQLGLLLARYLSEHGVKFLESWLQPYLILPGGQFWSQVSQNLVAIVGLPGEP